ncbi:TIGR02587 family membrane protein [Shinella sp. 838]|jgi:putative integral membrane protein (TIGR02587 family)|uniref:TIGR02587 family membrane protein n=1 Tax=unclassified Shinella TaxID=2643062 RepID=UPI0003C55DF4|nr:MULTISPECIES: TIGR02587 family membrane protein [unclassified Shinella]MCA0341168.1 TIGR02587 family membrane protein [Pseudomonadota bacterium]MDG4670431.1 TIGR02587 family membrane protein [Shinella sp. 838]
MAGNDAQTAADKDELNRFVTGLGRGVAGALFLALPMLMTMEMWHLGFSMARERLFLLLLLDIPLLILLAHRIGFEETFGWRETIRDAAIAYGIGILTSLVVLTALGLLRGGMPASELSGKVALQSVPASIGAMLGRSQLGHDDDDTGTKETSYAGELLLMAAGALFLSLNIAPTDEMMVLAYKMTAGHALAVALISIALMHGFVYAVSFTGGHELSPQTPWWHAFVRFTLPGYVIALAISIFALWIFERLGGSAPVEVALSVIVLGFPAALGAAAARLIL